MFLIFLGIDNILLGMHYIFFLEAQAANGMEMKHLLPLFLTVLWFSFPSFPFCIKDGAVLYWVENLLVLSNVG